MDTDPAAQRSDSEVPRRPPHWVTDLLLAIFITIMAFAPVPGDSYQLPTPLTLIFVGLALPLVPLRRRAPLAALAIAVVFFAVVAFAGTLSPGLALAIAVLVYEYTNRSTRPRGILVTLGVLVLLILLSIPAKAQGAFGPRVVQFALTIGIGAAAGDATRSRRQYIESITERVRRAEEAREIEAKRRVTDERLRIARDLHDVVAHQIAVISLNAGVASSAVERSPAQALTSLATIREASRTVLSEIGDLMTMLRNDEDGSSSAAAPQPELSRLPDLLRQFGDDGLDITVRREGDATRVPTAASVVAYRVVQEGLTNAHKHGTEHRAHVLLAVHQHEVEIIVTNPVSVVTATDDTALDAEPGAPFETQRGAGLGLIGARERVGSVRGIVHAGPTAGGWRMAVRIPLTADPLPEAPAPEQRA